MANKYDKSIAKVKNELIEITQLVLKLDQQVINLSNNAAKAGKAFKAGGMAETNRLMKEQAALMVKLQEQMNKQGDAIQKLTRKKKQYNALVEMGTQKEKARRAEIKLTIASTTNYAGAMAKLVAKQKQAKKTLEDLIASEKANERQLKRAQREYDNLTSRVNRAKQATSNFANTGLGKATASMRKFGGMAGRLMGAFGLVGGATLFASITRDVFNLTKKLESLRFALGAVTTNQGELGRVQEFLVDISNRYGAALVTTTERYTKFLAAAKQSNVSLKDTELIFETVTKASGVLGLKTDELTGIYLALEQMLSKGKVTTEELRRQLGERLPGAFGIMADALGVSVQKLDEMLKKGEILSAEALPKFAVALEKAYGIGAVTKIDTLVAAQTRLENKWIEFVDVLTNGDTIIKSIFAGILNFVTGILSAITEISKEIRDAFTSDEVKERLKTEEAFGKLQQEQIDKLNTIVSVQQRYNAALQQAFDLQDNITKRLVQSGDFTQGQAEETSQALIDLISNTRTYGEFLDKSTDIVDRQDILSQSYLATLWARIKGTNAVIDSTGKLIEQQNAEAKSTEDLNKKKKEGIPIQVGTLAWYDEQIRKTQELIDKTALSAEAYQELYDKLIQLQMARAAFEMMIKGGEQAGVVVDNTIKGVEDLGKAVEKYREQTKGFVDELTNEEKWKVFETATNTFSEIFDIDIDKFKFLFEEGKKSMEDWADLSVEVIGSVLDASLNRYEVELAEAQRARDLILNNELATEEQKRLARDRFEQKERDIKTRRAKAERNNNLFKIAIDTASSLVKATSYLANPLTAPAYPGIVAAIIGLGALQASIVAAQKIPKFEKGHLSGTHSGPALINDAKRSNYQEVVERRSGAIEMYKDRNQLIDMKKGDKVHSSMESFLNSYNLDDLFTMNVISDGRALNEAKALENMMFAKAMEKMGSKFDKTATSMTALAKRPVNVNAKVVVERPITKYE